jgi:hypothetical protein
MTTTRVGYVMVAQRLWIGFFVLLAVCFLGLILRSVKPAAYPATLAAGEEPVASDPSNPPAKPRVHFVSW